MLLVVVVDVDFFGVVDCVYSERPAIYIKINKSITITCKYALFLLEKVLMEICGSS